MLNDEREQKESSRSRRSRVEAGTKSSALRAGGTAVCGGDEDDTL